MRPNWTGCVSQISPVARKQKEEGVVLSSSLPLTYECIFAYSRRYTCTDTRQQGFPLSRWYLWESWGCVQPTNPTSIHGWGVKTSVQSYQILIPTKVSTCSCLSVNNINGGFKFSMRNSMGMIHVFERIIQKFLSIITSSL